VHGVFAVEFRWLRAQGVSMSTKEIVQDLLRRLPENVSLQEIAREIEFISAVREGIGELDRGELVPIEQVETEMSSWVIG
jgi:predicted transcriptional regulator